MFANDPDHTHAAAAPLARAAAATIVQAASADAGPRSDPMTSSPPTIALALQGGGSHGAFTWGVLDRLLQEVAANRLRVAAISGSSAGAINAALTVSGLVQGGPDIARQKLSAFWRMLSRRGFLAGNPLF